MTNRTHTPGHTNLDLILFEDLLSSDDVENWVLGDHACISANETTELIYTGPRLSDEIISVIGCLIGLAKANGYTGVITEPLDEIVDLAEIPVENVRAALAQIGQMGVTRLEVGEIVGYSKPIHVLSVSETEVMYLMGSQTALIEERGVTH